MRNFDGFVIDYFDNYSFVSFNHDIKDLIFT